jgi:class 3 adenylate cyclase
MELAEQVDPEEWHRVLDRFFQILTEGVHRYEGTISQYTGDGIMALFGAPIAHEDHAQRACYAALRLSDELRRYADELKREKGLGFLVRMGLNSGEVVVGKIGDDLRMDYTAQGHTVGLAARMEQLAEPGKTFLTEQTAKWVEGYCRLGDLGDFNVKGVNEPLRVFELQGVGPLRTRLEVAASRGLVRFVGRRGEMEQLSHAWKSAQEGHGQIVGVVGEAGVGKSRLVYEFKTPLELEDPQRLVNALDVEVAEIAEAAVSLDPLGGLLGQERLSRLRELLHARRETDGVPLSRVVHPEVVADLSDDHFAGIEAHSHGEIEPLRPPQLVCIATQLISQAKRRVAGPLRVVLVGDRGSEQSHDAVARVLADGPFVAMDALRQDLEETVENAVPLLGVDLLGQLQRALHVGEEHGHLLSLALERGLRLEDLVGEVLRGVVAGGALGLRGTALPRGSGAGRRADPCESLAFAGGDLLNVDELRDQLLEGLVVEVELTFQDA